MALVIRDRVYPYVGNITTLEAGQIVDPGCIDLGSGRKYVFNRHDLVEYGWITADTEYNFTSLTNHLHARINSYHMVVSVSIPYATEMEVDMLAYIQDYFNKTVTTFMPTGFLEDREILLQLPGDDDTAPRVKVKLDGYKEFIPKYLKDKYIGYSGIKLDFISYDIFTDMTLPMRVVPFTIPVAAIANDPGVLATSLAMPILEIYN